MVSIINIVMMCFDLLFAIGFTVFLFVFIKKKFHTTVSAFFIGCLVWIVFVMILEAIMHQLVLSSSIGQTIIANTYLYALYGGLAAGVFEETGRFVAMKFLMKKQYGNPGNSLMYGAGHGGIEVIFLLGCAMINNLVYSVMLNLGLQDTIIESVPVEQQSAIKAVFDSLIEVKPTSFLWGDFERISAVIFHISASVLVWIAIVYGKKIFVLFAILLHTILDAITVILSKNGNSVAIMELAVFVFAIVCAGIALYFWKKYIISNNKNNLEKNHEDATQVVD